MKLKVVMKTMRPPFLVLTPVCVLLGLGTALSPVTAENVPTLILVLLGALSAHAGVNMLNEYLDFKSGLDLNTRRTPFSGGSGALPDNPEMAGPVLACGLVALSITIAIGIYLTFEGAVQILPIGLLGVLLIVAYTPWLNRLPLLCLIAPGLGFGVLMVVGTQMILDSQHSPLAWMVSLVPFFLVNNLLLLNQYPDMEADAAAGRNTFPVAFGMRKSNSVYAVFALLGYSLIAFYVGAGYLPTLGAIALVPAVFSAFALIGALRYASRIGDFPRYLGANVAAAVLTPLLLAISIMSGQAELSRRPQAEGATASYTRNYMNTELTMKIDDDLTEDRTVIQTEEDRKALEKRLLGERSDDESADADNSESPESSVRE